MPIDESYLEQISSAQLALSRALAHVDPHATRAFLSAAVYSAREKGKDDDLLMELFNRTFPDGVLSPPASSDIIETMKAQQQGKK